jgi:hypothetical protein
MTGSAIARQAVTEGLATDKELREIAEGWRRWATHPDAWVRRPPRRDPLPRVTLPQTSRDRTFRPAGVIFQ